MKRTILYILALFFVCVTVAAQEESKESKEPKVPVKAEKVEKKDKMIFNHLSVGVTFGTPGFGLDVATTCTPYLQFRAGVAFIPNYKFKNIVEVTYDGGEMTEQIIETYNLPEEVELRSKIGMVNGKFLIDIFPFNVKRFPFFVSVGAYFGTSSLVKVNNTLDGVFNGVNEFNNDGHPGMIDPLGVWIGDEFFTPDAQGNAHASLKIKSFKPYVGIGFGRPVPLNKRVGFVGEIGAIFWNRPNVTLMDRSIDPDNLNNGVGDVLKVVKKITVYPCINFRICGRIL